MIKILDSSLTELATIQAATSAVRLEKINSDNTLKFSVRVKSGYGEYITDTSVFELDGDYFDIAYYKKEQLSDGRLLISVEAEHVSYRLNSSDYNVEYFTEIGTPTAILTAILDGTGFTVRTVDFSDLTTFSIQQASSRRGVLMQFAAYMEGELEFDGFEISLLEQRGSATPTALTVGKDITIASKIVDKRRLDSTGNPTISYKCGVYKGASLNLGDVVTLDYEALDIDASLRVVSKAQDPYNPNNVTIEVGNYVNSLEDDLYRIETQAVKKDALMNGTRIGPEYGFEAVRNDKLARAYFRSDGMALQSGDGSGTTWTDRLKYEYDSETGETTLVFNGKLSATLISALSALVTPNFYAGKATIAELTVDRLDTSAKVQKYLSEDISDVNYIRVYEQHIEFVTASTDGSESEQVTNRNGQLLFWVDSTHTAATTDDTGNPVMQYVYTEATKAEISFVLNYDTGYYEPEIIMGAGTSTDDPALGKFRVRKESLGGLLRYTKINGDNVDFRIGENGITGFTSSATDDGNFQLGFRIAKTKNGGALTVSSSDVIIGTLGVSLEKPSDVPVHTTISGSAADATRLTVKVYLDNIQQTQRKFTLYGTEDETLTFSSLLENISAGVHVVTLKATSDTSDVSIAINGLLAYALIPGSQYSSYSEGIVAFYNLDDANDSGSLGLNLTPYGTITHPAGKVGNCASFNGSSWYYIQNNLLTESFWGNRPYTVTGWFRTTMTHYASIIAVNEGGIHYDAFKIGMNDPELSAGGKLNFNRENGALSTYVHSANPYNDGNWHFFACIYDGADIKLSIDGGLELISVESTLAANHVTSLRIGSTSFSNKTPDQASTNGEEFVGSIDQVRFFNYALSTSEIADLWNGGTGI